MHDRTHDFVMKGESVMSQYAVPEEQHVEHVGPEVASPAPLGLGILAFATALIGCYYASFTVPYGLVVVRSVIAVALFVSGIVLVLAGMWEFRKNYLLTATTFTSYGGFLSILGLLFHPGIVPLPALSYGNELNLAIGLVFLCWTILSGVWLLGTLRTNASLVTTLALLFVAYLLLTIGQLAGGNVVLLRIGGWIAIVCALIAWLAALASIMSTTARKGGFRLPFSDRLATVE
jgi:succinate-acetate transporter protein